MSFRHPNGPLLVPLGSTASLILLLLCSGTVEAKMMTSGNITATIGNSVSLSCKLLGDGKVTQIEWTRCDKQKLIVYKTDQEKSVQNERFSEVTIQGFTLFETKREDGGSYCCVLSTYPHGNLRGRTILILKKPELPLILIVSITSGILIMVVLVIIFIVRCKKTKRADPKPVNVVVHQKRQANCYKKAHGAATNPQMESDVEDEGEEDSTLDYLNVSVLRLPAIMPISSSSLVKNL